MDRCSISNIAWPADQDDSALDLAIKLGFAGIEVAPAKVFGSLDDASPAAAHAYRKKLASRGLAIPALQAVLFGVKDIHLFESADARARLGARLDQVSALASELAAPVCVFGSPGLRDPGERDTSEAWRIAEDFFSEVAPSFAGRGTILCFEANPSLYNCRFITGTEEAIHLVKAVGRKGFSLQLDFGTVFINDEGRAMVEQAGRLASHCHISEPGLAPIGSAGADHAMTAQALIASGYSKWVSIEMRTVEDWRAAMTNAALLVQKYYQRPGPS
jgi:sugar phosphate isomerase/epimerase